MSKLIEVYFKGTPGDASDIKAREIFQSHGAQFEGSGTFLPDERDLAYVVDEDKVIALGRELKASGYTRVFVSDWEDNHEE